MEASTSRFPPSRSRTNSTSNYYALDDPANTTLPRSRANSFGTTPNATTVSRAPGSTASLLFRNNSWSRNNSSNDKRPPTATTPSTSRTISNKLSRNSSSKATTPNAGTASNSWSNNIPTLKALDSYSLKNVVTAVAPASAVGGNGASATSGGGVDALLKGAGGSSDLWQTLCVRVLPLFNGEGIRGHVEDLNELLVQHIQRTFIRCGSSRKSTSRQYSQQNPSTDLSSLVTGLLMADLTDLLRIGTLTLSSKLSSIAPSSSPQVFLSKLDEIWSFFFSNLLPNLEAIFWPLRCDERLKANLNRSGIDDEEVVSSRLRQGRTEKGSGRIDVRKFALITFRDEVVEPEMDRLRAIFLSGLGGEDGADVDAAQGNRHTKNQHSYNSNMTITGGSNLSNTPIKFITPRRRQLFAILASVLTDDERQHSIERLLASLRYRTESDNLTSRGPSDHQSAAAPSTIPPHIDTRGGFLGSAHGDRTNRDQGEDTPFSDQTSDFFDSPYMNSNPTLPRNTAASDAGGQGDPHAGDVDVEQGMDTIRASSSRVGGAMTRERSAGNIFD